MRSIEHQSQFGKLDVILRIHNIIQMRKRGILPSNEIVILHLGNKWMLSPQSDYLLSQFFGGRGGIERAKFN